MSTYVYILYSERIDKYYIGSSNDPEKRLHFHNPGKLGWTKRSTPLKHVNKKEFLDKKTATEKERYIKKMKERQFIEKIISCENDI